LCALVLDVDGKAGADLVGVLELWRDWPHLWHTTYSHALSSPSFRVVVPFARAVAAEAWPRVWAWAAERCAVVDPHCKDPSRMYFLPARRPGGPFEAGVWDEPSLLLDVSSLAPTKTRAPAEVPPTPRGGRAWGGGAPEWARCRAEREALREAQRRLREDPDVRRRAGRRLGGRLVGQGQNERVKGVACPRCGRPSVWWLVFPTRGGWWRCDHRNSCGAYGWLDQLLEAAA
jgi:hypothetical protein